jgi:urate oxidase / 2-oxo-4-hydroxy-4-carboxy-5-ureidoimidazoline decarboxylase
MTPDYIYQISYGKLQVPFYRAYGQPMRGLTPIPESPFTGRQNTLFAAEIDVEVFGDNFLPAYTVGDNSSVVATDSMKNFVFQQALAYDGATLEGFLDHLGRRFLATYPQMERLRLTGRELPFAPAPVPASAGSRDFVPSAVLFQRTHDDYALAVLEMTRDGQDAVITGHRCGRVGMQLLKVTGSAFTRFVRDQYTTLPERGDRPLFIALDVYWRYADTTSMLAPDLARYAAPEQIRDLVRVIFHEFVSESIQHLTHEMGTRLLARFPQLAEISFEGQNRTPDPMAVSREDEKVKVYSSAFPAFGLIKITMTRNG